MTKQELINRYGQEWYDEQRKRNNKKQNDKYKNDKVYREKIIAHAKNRYEQDLSNRRERYKNDIEYREKRKCTSRNWSKEHKREKYVKDGRIDLIENYELAKVENFKDWDIHHKLEIHDDYKNSRNELIMMNLYYDRPPEELIWLRRHIHLVLHNNK